MTSDGNEHPALRLGAVILAGGRSQRMGRPKALLTLAGRGTFLESVAAAYAEAGMEERLVVTFAALRDHTNFPPLPGVEIRVLDEPTASPLDTLCAALDRVPAGWHAFFVHPVDHPFVSPATLSAMARAFRAHRPAVVQVRHRGRGGHPVLLRKDLVPEIRAAPREAGLRAVVHADPDRVLRLEVPDPGVLAGMNTPEDLEGRSFPAPGRDA